MLHSGRLFSYLEKDFFDTNFHLFYLVQDSVSTWHKAQIRAKEKIVVQTKSASVFHEKRADIFWSTKIYLLFFVHSHEAKIGKYE